MTRVLHVCEPPDGGAALNAVDLAVGMAARGIEVAYAGPGESIFYDRLEAAGIPIHRLPLAPSFFNTHEDVRAYRSLRSLLGGGGFDLVHLHSSKAGVLGRLAARGTGAAVVYSPHSFPFVGDLPRPRIELARLIERRLAPLSDVILCVCDWELRLARSERLEPRGGLSRVYNGVEAPGPVETDPELREWAGEGPVVASVAVLREQKRIDLLIEAAPRILAGSPNVRVAIVGSGPDREALAALAAGLGLDSQPRFRMIPFANSSWAYLSGIDVYVLPSAWEAFPIGVLEALAAGVPQVATDVGGTGEAVLDGVTGLLVPPRDAAALASSVLALLAGDADLAAMSERSRERHREHFRLETTIAETLAVYGRLAPSLAGSGSPDGVS